MATRFDSFVRLDNAALNRLLRSSGGPVMRRAIEDGEIVKREARRLVGVHSPTPGEQRDREPGRLRDSIVKRLGTYRGDPAVFVGSADPIALLHHEGTRPHIITPRSKPRLVFYWRKAGRVVAFTRVNHPGARPNPFLTRALNALRGRY